MKNSSKVSVKTMFSFRSAIAVLPLTLLFLAPQSARSQSALNLPAREPDAVRSLKGVRRVALSVEMDSKAQSLMNSSASGLEASLRTFLVNNGLSVATEAQGRADRTIPLLRLRVVITPPERGVGEPVDALYLYSITLSALQNARLERAKTLAPVQLTTWRMEEIGVTETNATPQTRADFFQPRWNQFFAAFVTDWKKTNHPAPPSRMPAKRL